MTAAMSSLASGMLTRAGDMLTDFLPVIAIPLGIAVAAMIGAVIIGWVRSS